MPIDRVSADSAAAALPDAAADQAVLINGLVRRFGSVTAVSGLSLAMARGSIMALLGPNGAGKTTTVETCEGFGRPDAGSVRVLGLDPWRDAAALRPRVGVMLQSGGAHLGARTADMLGLVASCSANPHDARWLLDVLGLTHVAATPVRRLSGGQLQRLSLAMALIGRPELLFLDEPTAGLDPQARELVWELLRAVRADGVSVLLTTHLMDEAEMLADQVVIIDHGAVIADGTVAELIGAETEHLSFAATSGVNLALLLAALPPGYQVTEIHPGDYRIAGAITPQTMATVTAWCAQMGVLATGLQIGRRSLNDVYLDLTGRRIRT